LIVGAAQHDLAATAAVTGHAYIDGSLAYAFELERPVGRLAVALEHLGGFLVRGVKGLPDLIARLLVADHDEIPRL